jgi:hypothetical protein
MQRDEGDLRAEIRAEQWTGRIAARNDEHYATLQMTAAQRVDRYLAEPLGHETEDLIDLLRDLQLMFRDARVRVVERRKERSAPV